MLRLLQAKCDRPNGASLGIAGSAKRCSCGNGALKRAPEENLWLGIRRESRGVWLYVPTTPPRFCPGILDHLAGRTLGGAEVINNGRGLQLGCSPAPLAKKTVEHRPHRSLAAEWG